jgi:S-(hydroxymethyl)glutathione dehydrogenase/alcohol dehydrogenase
VEAVRKLSGGGVMHAFEVIGIKATAQQTIKMVGIGGAAYLIGAQKPGTSIEVDVLTDLMLKQASIRGVNMGSTNSKRDIPMYATMYLQGRLNLDDLISKEINLSEINEAYAELKKGVIARSVITSF